MSFLIIRLKRWLRTHQLIKPLLIVLILLLIVLRVGWHQRIIAPDPALTNWHDYPKIEAERVRTGLGEHGVPAHLPADTDAKLKADLFQANGFNGLLSDKIALDRSIRDLRYAECHAQLHYRRLPTAALVIPFHEEHLSTLLRTAVSCRNRAPRHLLTQLILVDDASQKAALGAELEAALAKTFPSGFARLLRAPKREGLIRARMRGIAAASADVVIVMDSHCECGINWLPPLLHPIAEDYRTVVCPFIDVIDMETFEIRPQDTGARGSWSWNSFHYKRLPLLSESLRKPAEPFASPVMAGGLFAISRRWFNELGGYDSGLDIWGGEQYELSFKIWQCGGRMLDAPCSRIAHIYRNFMPYRNPSSLGDFITRNFKRVAEVWMDEYKEFLYKTNNEEQFRLVDAGDLTQQKAVREKLKCKSFRWFMENVAFDQPKHFPFVEPQPAATGELRNQGNGLCIDTKFRGEHAKIEVDKCLSDGGQGEQRLVLTYRKDIRPAGKDVCFDVPNNADRAPVILFGCHGFQGNQWWKLLLSTGQLKHPVTDKCLDSDKATRELFVSVCDPAKTTQRWLWQSVNSTLAETDANNPDTELRMHWDIVF